MKMSLTAAKAICAARAVRVYDERKGVEVYDDWIRKALLLVGERDYQLQKHRYKEADEAIALAGDYLYRLNDWLDENVTVFTRSQPYPVLVEALLYLLDCPNSIFYFWSKV